jgi:hypothetical protein
VWDSTGHAGTKPVSFNGNGNNIASSPRRRSRPMSPDLRSPGHSQKPAGPQSVTTGDVTTSGTLATTLAA